MAEEHLSEYLRGVPTLSDTMLQRLESRKRLTAREERSADRQVAKLKAEIRARRDAYNTGRGPDDVIVPEPPVEC